MPAGGVKAAVSGSVPGPGGAVGVPALAGVRAEEPAKAGTPTPPPTKRPSFRRPDERERAVVLVVVEVRLRQRRRRGEGGLVVRHRIIVAAQREAPLRPGLRPAAGTLERRPRDAALDRPAGVLVVPLVEGAVERHLRLHAPPRQRREALVAAAAARRQEQLQLGVEGVDLELVIGQLLLGRLE